MTHVLWIRVLTAKMTIFSGLHLEFCTKFAQIRICYPLVNFPCLDEANLRQYWKKKFFTDGKRKKYNKKLKFGKKDIHLLQNIGISEKFRWLNFNLERSLNQWLYWYYCVLIILYNFLLFWIFSMFYSTLRKEQK